MQKYFFMRKYFFAQRIMTLTCGTVCHHTFLTQVQLIVLTLIQIIIGLVNVYYNYKCGIARTENQSKVTNSLYSTAVEYLLRTGHRGESSVGDLNIDQDGNLFVAHNDVQKAEALHDFFASVLYIQESREVFDTLPTRWKINDMELLSVVEARDVNFGFVQKSIIVLKK